MLADFVILSTLNHVQLMIVVVARFDCINFPFVVQLFNKCFTIELNLVHDSDSWSYVNFFDVESAKLIIDTVENQFVCGLCLGFLIPDGAKTIIGFNINAIVLHFSMQKQWCKECWLSYTRGQHHTGILHSNCMRCRMHDQGQQFDSPREQKGSGCRFESFVFCGMNIVWHGSQAKSSILRSVLLIGYMKTD